jgi:hypothetical protein
LQLAGPCSRLWSCWPLPFIDVKDTISLIPNWLPGHLFWTYFTGCAFIAAGVAALTGVCARLAVTLSVLQITLFLVLVWLPIVATGSGNAFQWSETILNVALSAAVWVVADSYRGTKWFDGKTALQAPHGVKSRFIAS